MTIQTISLRRLHNRQKWQRKISIQQELWLETTMLKDYYGKTCAVKLGGYS